MSALEGICTRVSKSSPGRLTHRRGGPEGECEDLDGFEGPLRAAEGHIKAQLIVRQLNPHPEALLMAGGVITTV